MNTNTYFFSDPHFFHANIIKFGRPFNDVHEMNEHMVKNWNEVVSHQDKVWVLGDCVFAGKENLSIFQRLNGSKYLVLGNHDGGDKTKYLNYFKKIEGAMDLGNGIILSHYPVHPQCMEPHYRLNVHGHTHEGVILGDHGLPDHRYVCVSAEQVGYRPVTLDWIINQSNKRRENARAFLNSQKR